MTTPSPDPEAPAPEPSGQPSKFHALLLRLRRAFRNLVLLFLLLFAGYTLIMYHWSYSSGERGGILRKFSRKGWLCKTWEGELAMTTVPGVMPEPWPFTVRSDAVAAAVTGAVGKEVVVHYQEHRGLWTSCFGETRYFVDSVRVVEGD